MFTSKECVEVFIFAMFLTLVLFCILCVLFSVFHIEDPIACSYVSLSLVASSPCVHSMTVVELLFVEEFYSLNRPLCSVPPTALIFPSFVFSL